MDARSIMCYLIFFAVLGRTAAPSPAPIGFHFSAAVFNHSMVLQHNLTSIAALPGAVLRLFDQEGANSPGFNGGCNTSRGIVSKTPPNDGTPLKQQRQAGSLPFACSARSNLCKPIRPCRLAPPSHALGDKGGGVDSLQLASTCNPVHFVFFSSFSIRY